jgi:hypothetical protein
MNFMIIRVGISKLEKKEEKKLQNPNLLAHFGPRSAPLTLSRARGSSPSRHRQGENPPSSSFARGPHQAIFLLSLQATARNPCSSPFLSPLSHSTLSLIPCSCTTGPSCSCTTAQPAPSSRTRHIRAAPASTAPQARDPEPDAAVCEPTEPRPRSSHARTRSPSATPTTTQDADCSSPRVYWSLMEPLLSLSLSHHSLSSMVP